MGETKAKYPIGFYVSSLTYTFERFAFYGSKPMLIVFLITAAAQGGLGIDTKDAAIIAANFTAWTYIAPVIGGYICDHWLGARYAVSIGCVLMAIGYLFGWKATSVGSINMMIAVVSIGTGLFKGNLAAIIGRLFEDEELLDSAFSIQYSFVNLGALLGSLITGVLYVSTFKQGDVMGFRQVFLVCAIIVLLGGIFFTLGYGTLQGQGKKPFKYITDKDGNVIGESHQKETDDEAKAEAKAPLTKNEKKRVVAIVFISLVSVIFWLFYLQQDIVLSIYMVEKVNMQLGGFTVTPQHLTTSWNGFLCVFLSIMAAKLWYKLSQRPQGDISMFQKVALAFLFLGISYVVLIFMEMSRGVGADNTHKVTVLWLFLFGTLLTIGEICFSPLGNSFVSKYAPKKYLSVLMGVWTLATFFANLINGQFQKIVEKMGIMPVFVTFAIVAFICAVIMFLLTKPLNKLTEE